MLGEGQVVSRELRASWKQLPDAGLYEWHTEV